jgi:TIR domain
MPFCKVFISHASADAWVARQLKARIEACGAETFLDETDIEHGDDFEEEILRAADSCTELVVLLTPWSTMRPYIWMEIGLFWGANKRIVVILYGLSQQDLVKDQRLPIALKRLDVVELNHVESYIDQLARRAKSAGSHHA